MREFDHGKRLGRLAAALVTLVASLGSAAPGRRGAAARAWTGSRTAPRPPGRHHVGRAAAGSALRDRMDASGTLTGYEVRVGRERLLRLGPGGFADGPFGGVAVVGERDGDEHAAGGAGAAAALRGPAADRGPALVYGSHLDAGPGRCT